MKTIAIGDIHGEFQTLVVLLARIPFEEVDTLVFLGDYIDRGPQSDAVIRALRDLKTIYKDHIVLLRGNHEDMAFEALGLIEEKRYRDGAMELWEYNGGTTTLDSYEGLGKALREDMQWLYDNTVYYYDTPDYFFVHAGVLASPLTEQFTMPDIEKRDTFLWSRWPFIHSKYDWGKKIIFGHTAKTPPYVPPKQEPFTPWVQKNKIGIDTAVCPPASHGLTALILPEETFVFQKTI